MEEPKSEQDTNGEAREVLSTTGLCVTKPSCQPHGKNSSLPTVLKGFSCHLSNPNPQQSPDISTNPEPSASIANTGTKLGTSGIP